MLGKKKKMALLSLSTMLTAGSIIGCSSAQPAKPNPTNDKKAADSKTVPQPITLRWMLPESQIQPIVVDSPAIKEIKNKMNVDIKLEPVPQSNYVEKKKALIATNNIPDVIKVDDKDAQEFARTGMFLSISDYLDQAPNFKKAIESRPEINKFKVDGKLYGFPVLEKYRIGVAPQPMIRVDLLKKLNLQPPTTFDELYQVLKKLKEAYPDSIPFTGRNGTKSLFGQLAYPLGSGGFPGFSANGIYFEPKTGKYVYGPAAPEFKNAVTFINKLYSEKLLDPDYATNTAQMWQEKLSSGKSFFFWDNDTYGPRAFNKALKEKDPNAQFDILPPLKNAAGESRSYRYEKDWMRNIYAINSKVKDPSGIVKFFDWMYSEEGMLVTNFGVNGEHYDIVNGKPWMKDSIIQQHKGKPDIFASIQSALGVGLLTFAVYVDETTLEQVTDPQVVELGKKIDQYTGKGIDFILNNPPFTKEEADKLKRLETQVGTMFEQEIDKFIMGVRLVSDYDKFRQQLIEKGVPEIEKIYNDALARVK